MIPWQKSSWQNWILIRKNLRRERRTVVENAEEAVFEEKKVEEQEVVFLMDRFGYAKTVDMAVYERNKEAADAENKYIATLYEYRTSSVSLQIPERCIR